MDGVITVFLADDNIFVLEGVRALLQRQPDLDVIGVAADYDELVAGAEAAEPQVLVTDIRMPPTFQREGIEAAKELRKRHPGTGVVILSQYDDPDYAVSLLSEGSAGYGYLLKDRVAEGDQLAEAIRVVAAGGTALDPSIVEQLLRPVRRGNDLSEAEDELLRQVAEGRPIKSIAASGATTPEAVADRVDAMFLKLAEGASTGASGALRRLRLLHQAIVDREEQGQQLSRLLPGRLAEKLRMDGREIGRTEEVEVTVVMSDVRGYSAIAERSSPTELAAQLNEHRAAMNAAILAQEGTVMQFVGDAVMAVFGAPFPQANHADRALAAAAAMHEAQEVVNAHWEESGRSPFGLGIGLSTGIAAAALLGSEERLEYTIVGDTVNLTQRLQQWARPGETIISSPTWQALSGHPTAEELPPALVSGRETPVQAWKVPATVWAR